MWTCPALGPGSCCDVTPSKRSKMADQNTSSSKPNLYSEVLTPSELFLARSRSHKIPVRGQKDFIPDGSEEQKQKLEQALNEHWSLISEERVERLGSLVKGVWIPEEQIIELQTPAGKFWQTMGFSAKGKQYLLPEEALFLMECGNVQVFYQDLPFSIQDGYENFLSSKSITFQQYLVYGHLKRLGYVVLRFDPSSEPSAYARQLNLPVSRDQTARGNKRKRSPSPPRSSNSRDETTVVQMEQDPVGQQSGTPSCQTEVESVEEEPDCKQDVIRKSEVKQRSWWSPGKTSGSCSVSGSRQWDFSSIHFPDVGSALRSRPDDVVSLAAPDPSLLPGALTVGPCDVIPWRQRINLKEVYMSPKDRQREEEANRRWMDVNRDPEVRSCKSWAEYRALLARRGSEVRGHPGHLWDREVTPLHDPRQSIPHEELLDKISIIKPTNLLEGASGLKPLDNWRISFSVFQPDSVSSFKKSNPGRPYARMVVCSFNDPVPDLAVLKQLSSQSPEVALVFAAVDHGDISFYTFKDFHIPKDVFP
ncbi:tRNA-splicing endonuclease subunit Sen54 [Periophthalmus magnuspinnatus]|uniref:tRNA-splicing endonuclease subunit Sen54 n=1 Tax=Periophthalmus magnuspinnatus TaxID=409849 RepID=UPI0024369395|nr:tRNA-splicing endonuclease subunit Sen54 [Periophthalmus magnuspinnatus]